MNTIFVQIASYRDPELVPTVLDLMEKAKYPENLKICIAWQHDKEETIDPIFKLKEMGIPIIILDIPAKESLGCCWARSLIQKQYNDEDYTLCLDSHHRFKENWDELCIQMYEKMKSAGSLKPLLTTYVPSYSPTSTDYSSTENTFNYEALSNTPWVIRYDKFNALGSLSQHPDFFFNAPDKPVKARFLSAHFLFTSGQWNKEVIYDPNLYFSGEEISLAARSYTWGYDMFHPNIVVAWHEYTRSYRTKHWDDDKEWWKKDGSSHDRLRKLLGMDPCDIDFGVYGFGPIRTLAEYQNYSNINFKERQAGVFSYV